MVLRSAPDEIKTKDKPKSKSWRKPFGGSKKLYIFLCIITLGIFLILRSAPEEKQLSYEGDDKNKLQNKNENEESKTNETKESVLSKSDSKTKPLQKVNSQSKAESIENNKDDYGNFDQDQHRC